MFDKTTSWKKLASSRGLDLSESKDLYLNLANELRNVNIPYYSARADFILEQINGKTGADIFNRFRGDWGIPIFDEDIININDFKYGFLWCFRDHTTSWSDNQLAKAWFLTSAEAMFIRRYEFWSWDQGFDECIETRQGSYKSILKSLLDDGDYEVLSSPEFSQADLHEFITLYKTIDGDFTIEEIIEDYIEHNPNYKP